MSKIVFRARYRAFTIVELLVVIAIIGVLVSLLLPAVGAVRDAARRTQNENNLKQIGMAIISYEGQHETFPPMIRRSKFMQDPNDLQKTTSWAFEILPFLEQQVIYDKFDPQFDCFAAENIPAMRTEIETFINPRRAGRQRTPFANVAAGGGNGAPLDYAANGGIVVDEKRNVMNLPSDPSRVSNGFPFDRPFDPRLSGPFHAEIAVPAAAVRDGQANTLGVGDRWMSIAVRSPLSDQAGLAGDSVYTTVRFGNLDTGGRAFPLGRDDPSVFKFGSPKGTDACFAYLDGHVRWIPYDVDVTVFQSLCSINDGNVIPADSF